MLNAKSIGSIIIGIILLNNSLFPIIPLPGIITIIAIVAAAALLLMDSAKGGIIGKASLILGIIIGIYALAAILSLIGISIPFIGFIYSVQKYAYILGGILLIMAPFASF